MAKRKTTEARVELVHSSRFTELLVPALPHLDGKVRVDCTLETVLFDFKLVEPDRTLFILYANAKEMLHSGLILRRFEDLRSTHSDEYSNGAATIFLLTRLPEATKAFSLRQVRIEILEIDFVLQYFNSALFFKLHIYMYKSLQLA